MEFSASLQVFLESRRVRASYPVYRRLVAQHFHAWRDWPTWHQIEAWHQSIAKRPHQANKGLSLLKSFYYWAVRHGHCDGPNPTVGIKRHKVLSRDRVLTSLEVRTVLCALDLMPPKLAALLTVLLTTGCRLSEALQMERAHVDLVSGQWRQPKTKNGRLHVTYLPTQARRAIIALRPNGDYVFGGYYDRHWSRAGAEKVWSQVRGVLNLSDVRLHDFRRTFASHLFDATSNDYLVKRCINHVNTSVTAIYVRIPYEKVAVALQEQADRFFALTQEDSHAITLAGHRLAGPEFQWMHHSRGETASLSALVQQPAGSRTSSH